MDLLEKLKNNRKLRKKILFPGVEEEEIYIRILSDQEQLDVEKAADEYMKNMGLEYEQVNFTLYSAEVTRRVLFKALSDEGGKPLFKNVDVFREMLSVEQRDLLGDQYEIYEEEISPVRACKTEKDMENLIEEIKKKPEMTLLNIFDISLLKNIITTLVPQVKKPRKTN